ncbi:MAG: DUF481 domain-containing protein, partial [Verrucomicrobiota bacterium]
VPAARAKERPISTEDAQAALQRPTWARIATQPEPTATEAAGAKAAAASTPSSSPTPPPAAATTTQAAPDLRPPGPPKPRSRWTRLLEIGYALQASTVSKSDAYLRAELARITENYSYRLLGKYLYGEQQDIRNVDKTELGFIAQHDLAGRWRLRNNLAYQNDQLRLLDLEITEVLGLNYALIRHRKFRFSGGPGLGFRYREPEIGKTGYTFSADFSQEMRWELTNRISLAQSGSYLTDPNDTRNYRLRSSAVATGRLTEKVSINIRYEYEFDHARPVITDRTDQRVFTTLGYTF